MKYYTEPKFYDLLYFMKSNNMTYREFGELVGISNGYIHALIAGKYIATPETAQKILYVCNNYKKLISK